MQNWKTQQTVRILRILLYMVYYYVSKAFPLHFQYFKEQNQWVVKCLCFGYCCQIQIHKYSERFWQWFRWHQMKLNNKTTIKLMCSFNVCLFFGMCVVLNSTESIKSQISVTLMLNSGFLYDKRILYFLKSIKYEELCWKSGKCTKIKCINFNILARSLISDINIR